MKILRRHNAIRRSGFTLIELLVVISIISLLSSVVLTSVNSARAKARDGRRKADVSQVKTALEFYYDTNNTYPSIGVDNVGYDWQGLAGPLAPYIPQIPRDPGSGWHTIQYVRGPVSDNSYGIWMRYEATGYCRTGINMNMGWWGTIPICQ